MAKIIDASIKQLVIINGRLAKLVRLGEFVNILVILFFKEQIKVIYLTQKKTKKNNEKINDYE